MWDQLNFDSITYPTHQAKHTLMQRSEWCKLQHQEGSGDGSRTIS